MLTTTLLGVALACLADQSETAIEQPMGNPEVFLQLKYDGGELERIYLTQFRKEGRPVPARQSLCTELCHAGFGGDACGSACLSLMPVGLKTALTSGNKTSEQYGQPRVDVCPSLCNNQLGEPLCNCGSGTTFTHPTNWTMVCEAFCVTDGYVLNGCPACDSYPATVQTLAVSARMLDTVEGWQTWCNVQCRQGQGGAACNCDRMPF
ncbi:uncharacterized protein LOC119836333 [Zerene cesonia]|uniref:uncharacterized protein LOC119836333 n=1 Tax=Zerene cesonia TaxID=33412 RepID=UPI0018E528D4|nr:uncharacterized protein LOC119836333 [Zerene cesonia]